ncbi:hypothetical protein, partial [Deinococcus sp.]|uniref:hypothetical protein n=1 Tax=Deinococcus sp. TaxID=47478 RepID=UPI002869BCE8
RAAVEAEHLGIRETSGEFQGLYARTAAQVDDPPGGALWNLGVEVAGGGAPGRLDTVVVIRIPCRA